MKPSALVPPAIALLALGLLPLAIAIGVRPAARNGVHAAQPDRRAPDDAAGAEALAERLAAAQGQQHVHAAPGGGDAGAVDLEAGQVEVAGEEQHGREGHGQRLEGAEVQRRDERREAHGRHG